MKKQIRQGTFETNSSSCHAIVIAKDDHFDIPETVSFDFGEYGWECDTYRSRKDRANYLYTCLGYMEQEDIEKYIKFIVKTLKAHGVKNIFMEGFKYSPCLWNDRFVFIIRPGDGYVDHGDETRKFVEAVCSDEDRLLRYLFSDKSFIMTGNDNDGTTPHINVDYDHEEYEKWN